MKRIATVCIIALLMVSRLSVAFGMDEVKTFATFCRDEVKAVAQASDPQTQEAIYALLDELAVSSCVIRQGRDAEQRPVFVGAQAAFERFFVSWLQSETIVELICIIHTPAPAKPLCSAGDVGRPVIVRDLLEAGAEIVTVYPRGGRSVRSPEQLQILDDLLDRFPNLSAVELPCSEFPSELIGATYLITLCNGQKCALFLRGSQAHAPKENGTWGIWFGTVQNPIVRMRAGSVLMFLEAYGVDGRKKK